MNITRRTLVALLSVAALMRALPAPAAEKTVAVEVKTNLTYYSGEGADKYRHRLDMYVPKGQHENSPMLQLWVYQPTHKKSRREG